MRTRLTQTRRLPGRRESRRLLLSNRGRVQARVDSILARTGNPEVSPVASRLVPCGGAGASLGQIDSAETPGSDEEHERWLDRRHGELHTQTRGVSKINSVALRFCISLRGARREPDLAHTDTAPFTN